jgi:glutamate formiminotransferase/formiminotetrahydrofolate cyclodeaminase
MSRGKKAYIQFDAELAEAQANLGVLREELKSAIDADAASYQAVVSAYRAQKNADPQQVHGAALAVAEALRGAADVPLHVAECASQISTWVGALRKRTNPKMGSDLTVAAALAKAAFDGALANVEINLESFDAGTETSFIEAARIKVTELRKKQPEKP